MTSGHREPSLSDANDRDVTMLHSRPPETIEKPRGRRHRCPECRASFQTLRLSRLACPECGHAWEPKLGENLVGDAFTNLTEHAFMGFMLLVTIGVLIIALLGALKWVGMASEGRGTTAVIVVVVMLLSGTAISICAPSMHIWAKLSRSDAASIAADKHLDRLNGEDLARIHRVDPEYRPPSLPKRD